MSLEDATAYVAEVARRARGEDPQPVESAPVDPLQHSFATAWTHVDPAAAGVSGIPRRLVRKGIARFLGRQERFNRSILTAVQELHGRAEQRLATTNASLSDTARLTVAISERVDDLFNRVTEFERMLLQADYRLADLDAVTRADRAEHDELKKVVHGLRTDLKIATAAAQRAADAHGEPASPTAGSPLVDTIRAVDTVDEQFYSDLEAEFRGSRDHVLSTLRMHVDTIEAAPIDHDHPAADLGCGRGEWLELLAEYDRPAIGVDLSSLFVEECRQLGYEAVVADAIGWLRSRKPESLGLVTAFHLIEHLPLAALVGLFDAALVALRPGGVLLVETPNPLNVVTGAADFYLDPTHDRPLHPEFVRFLASRQGFAEPRIRFMAEPAEGPTLADLAGPDDDAIRAYLAETHRHLFGAQSSAVVAHRG